MRDTGFTLNCGMILTDHAKKLTIGTKKKHLRTIDGTEEEIVYEVMRLVCRYFALIYTNANPGNRQQVLNDLKRKYGIPNKE